MRASRKGLSRENKVHLIDKDNFPTEIILGRLQKKVRRNGLSFFFMPTNTLIDPINTSLVFLPVKFSRNQVEQALDATDTGLAERAGLRIIY
jgi:hypothetical protein